MSDEQDLDNNIVDDGQANKENPDGQPVGENEDEKPADDDGEPKPDPNEEKKKAHQLIKQGLSQIGKIHDNSGYAFITLKIEEKEVTTLYDILNNYPHLRYISFSNNKLTDLTPFTTITNLLTLNVSKNEIPNMKAFNENNPSMNFLQFLDLSENKLTKFEPFHLPKLRNLNLSGNQITTCVDFQGHPTLQILDIRRNKLKRCQGLCNMPLLTDLYLGENEIIDFRELFNLPSLKNLELKQNSIEKIRKPLPNLPYIYHIDLSVNKLPNLQQVIRLQDLFNLKSLNISGNPCADELGDGIKKELIMVLPQLIRINDEDISLEERTEAMNELRERILAAEEKRKEEEEAARKNIEEQEAPIQDENQTKKSGEKSF